MQLIEWLSEPMQLTLALRLLSEASRWTRLLIMRRRSSRARSTQTDGSTTSGRPPQRGTGPRG
ncbi:hypothetical protein Slala04_38470 [Streptomyces lavendulae subsp. lavendulae]|nr:hypothetical protein Slala04_38470 [Streptomyces lavendulae subsp. lavendulae]